MSSKMAHRQIKEEEVKETVMDWSNCLAADCHDKESCNLNLRDSDDGV
jgi:hypothetical protein